MALRQYSLVRASQILRKQIQSHGSKTRRVSITRRAFQGGERNHLPPIAYPEAYIEVAQNALKSGNDPICVGESPGRLAVSYWRTDNKELPPMGVKQYQLGKKHALEGIRAMAHRKLKPYDSRSANESYIRGYSDGVRERGTSRLDYTKKLNNQLFIREGAK